MVKAFLTPSSLFLASWRFFKKHPWQFWLTILSIALGSAVMIAVDLANNSASVSFKQSVETVGGHMTHRIVPVAQTDNTPQGIDETLYTRLRIELGISRSAPVIEADISIRGESYQLIGIDIFAEPLFSHPLVDNRDSGNDFDTLLTRLLSEPNSVLLSQNTAKHLGLTLDQAFLLPNQTTITPIGHFSDNESALLDGLIISDIASAQNIVNKIGQLDRIELILNEKQIDTVQQWLPPTLRLQTVRNEKDALNQMTEAFRINLMAMSLLAMLVGAFLVYNTMTFSVLQRRKQFAIERMLGVTGKQLFIHILIEALLLGLIGSILGIILGVLLGQALLILINQTINDLYSAADLSVLLVQPLLIIKGIGIALIAVIIATIAPALEAAKVPPAAINRPSELETQFQRLTPLLVVAGLLLLVLSAAILWLFDRSLIGGFVALFIMVIGYSLLIPQLIHGLLSGVYKLLSLQRLGILSRMAVRGIHTSLSRTNLAIIALAIAVSATVGVGIMITSFRATVADWLETTLQSDLYISAHSDNSSQVKDTLEDFWLEAAKELDGIQSISTGRAITLKKDNIPIPTLVLNPGQHGQSGFKFLAMDEPTSLWQRYHAGDIVFISEPFAYHHQLKAGDRFNVNRADQTQTSLTLKVGAIYQDYSATQGVLVMPDALFQRHWHDPRLSSIGLLLEKGTDPALVRAQIRTLAQKGQKTVKIRSNKEIRDLSLTVFDRTFAITQVLRLLVILVAFVGVFSALMALFLEKAREYAVLRATGITPKQLNTMVLLQTGFIGVLAGLLALPLGWVMSEILIHVINQRSFGWSMSRSFPLMIIVQALLLSTIAALLAALYPLRRLSRLSIREGLRQ